jgi:hypothetical protein
MGLPLVSSAVFLMEVILVKRGRLGGMLSILLSIRGSSVSGMLKEVKTSTLFKSRLGGIGDIRKEEYFPFL